MNKGELIAITAKNVGFKKSVAEKTLNIVLDTITKVLKTGGEIKLSGFGTFTVSKRSARKGRNPKTGKEIIIPSCKVPKFKAGNKLKETLKQQP
jgi:DNA-binding protein HU-beta